MLVFIPWTSFFYFLISREILLSVFETSKFFRDRRFEMKGAAMDLWEPIGAWATSRPGLAFQPVCGCFVIWGHVLRRYLNSADVKGGGTAEIEDFKQVCFLRHRWPWQLEQIFMVVGQPRKPQMIEHRRWRSGVWRWCSSAVDLERKVWCFKSKIKKRQLI